MGFHVGVYLKVNALICAFGLATYAMAVRYAGDTIAEKIAWTYVGAVLRNGSLVAALTLFTRNQPSLSSTPRQQPTLSEDIEMVCRMLFTACLGDVAIALITEHYRGFANFNDEPWWPALTFIPHLFLFEIVFDFCHYSVHRLCHDVGWLYRHAHKLHHKFLHPTPLGTYMQVSCFLYLCKCKIC